MGDTGLLVFDESPLCGIGLFLDSQVSHFY